MNLTCALLLFVDWVKSEYYPGMKNEGTFFAN